MVSRSLKWTELLDTVNKHRKFADAAWALKKEQVDKIAVLAEKLAPDAPEFRHQRLFSERDFDLYETKEDYIDQQAELKKFRQRAIEEIAENGGDPSNSYICCICPVSMACGHILRSCYKH